MESDLSLHIDLNNFEDVKFESSKYVLTSPRSLEACSRLNVKPVELLYKPLSEFQEELLPQDIPLRTIYAVFDESEQIRKQKLELCREERSRIINADKKEGSNLPSPTNRSSFCSHDAELMGRTFKKVSNRNQPNQQSISGSKILQGPVDNESLKLHRELLSKKDRTVSNGRPGFRRRPESVDGRKAQRCSSSASLGPKIRFRCGSAPAYKLPARDEKILKLMHERRESEQRSLALSEQAHRLWEEQRKREEILKTIAENKRRELLIEDSRIRDVHRAETAERLAQKEEEKKEIQRLDIQDSEHNVEAVLMNKLRMRELQISEKIQKEAAKKEIQESNLKAKERENEEVKQLLLAKQISDLDLATEKKEMKIHQKSLKKFLDNRQEREKFEKRHKFLTNQQRENDALVRSSMEHRLTKAQSNLSQILEQRNLQIKHQHQDELARLQRARRSQTRLDAEMDAWRSDLLQQEKQIEDRALEVANRSIELKSLQARKNRIVKEREQRKNISRLRKDDEKYRCALAKSLQQKERKVEEMIEHKERSVAQMRAMAQLSQTLRDDIKEKYNSDTFDKKVLEAQLYANINREQR